VKTELKKDIIYEIYCILKFKIQIRKKFELCSCKKKAPTLTGSGLVENINHGPRLTGHSPQPSWTSRRVVVPIPTGTLVRHHHARLNTCPSSLAVRHDRTSRRKKKKKKKFSLCSRREIAQQTSVPAAAEMKVVRFNIVRNGPGAVNVPLLFDHLPLYSRCSVAPCICLLRGLRCFLYRRDSAGWLCLCL
jgi:hypothetical protein